MEGLLSTGPTPSSFLSNEQRVDYIFFFMLLSYLVVCFGVGINYFPCLAWVVIKRSLEIATGNF